MPNESYRRYLTDWERLLAYFEVREAGRPALEEGGASLPGDYHEG